MAGVDLNDQLRSYYPIGRKSFKWWRSCFWYLVEVSMVNAYILHRNIPPPNGLKPLNHLQFHQEVARSLLKGMWIKEPQERLVHLWLEWPEPPKESIGASENSVLNVVLPMSEPQPIGTQKLCLAVPYVTPTSAMNSAMPSFMKNTLIIEERLNNCLLIQ